jgi:hypothetical protein
MDIPDIKAIESKESRRNTAFILRKKKMMEAIVIYNIIIFINDSPMLSVIANGSSEKNLTIKFISISEYFRIITLISWSRGMPLKRSIARPE